MDNHHEELFPTGTLMMTNTIHELVRQGVLTLESLLTRHRTGDWGDVTPSEANINDTAAHLRLHQIVSKYRVNEQEVWVVSKPNGPFTLVLTRHEYESTDMPR
ncbi:MAG: hypothetical protein KatS3mg104_1801 [Phycisphaerae bacterium]|jgi:hypothetical protein|nr:MAG: hypothetical protein KatS3mg104_1801 [Phycisphaerae bacterium]